MGAFFQIFSNLKPKLFSLGCAFCCLMLMPGVVKAEPQDAFLEGYLAEPQARSLKKFKDED